MRKNRELISAPTRDAFRDAATSLFKAKRINCFARLCSAGIQPVGLPRDRAPTIGELVEAFYAAIDWTDRGAIAPFMPIFYELFHHAPDSIWDHRQEMKDRLFRDGVRIKDGKLC